MKNAGYAHMGVGSARGKDKAEVAAREAISSPLLETSIKGAKGILISMSVSPDVSLDEVDLASTMITNEANPNANVIWGVSFNNELENEMRITIIATGFEKKPGDEHRLGMTVNTNPESPFRAAPARPAAPAGARPAPAPAARPAQPMQKREAPVRRPAPVADADDGDIFDMMKGISKS